MSEQRTVCTCDPSDRTQYGLVQCPEQHALRDCRLAQVDSLRAQLAEAQGYATRFLESFVHQHCDPVPDWRPLPDLIGVLTQIDNATTVVRDYKDLLARARDLLEDASFRLPGDERIKIFLAQTEG